MGTVERPWEDTARRQLSTSKEERLQQNLTLMAPWSWTSSPPELWGSTFLLSKPLSLRYSMMAAWANMRIHELNLGGGRILTGATGQAYLFAYTPLPIRAVFFSAQWQALPGLTNENIVLVLEIFLRPALPPLVCVTSGRLHNWCTPQLPLED